VTSMHYNWPKFEYLGGMYIYFMGDEMNWTIVPIFSFLCLQFPIQEIEGARTGWSANYPYLIRCN
jgi:hypothetical protein